MTLSTQGRIYRTFSFVIIGDDLLRPLGYNDQGSLCAQPTTDDVTLLSRFSLAECIHKMIAAFNGGSVKRIKRKLRG